MQRTSCVSNLCVGLLVALGACGGDEVTAPTGPFQLTFQGDASFQGPHAGHTLSVAVVRISDGAVVAQRTSTVSASADLAFSFTFTGLLGVGVAYQVHYWIDSNFGGGTAGVCDPKAIDHQWNVALAAVEGDVTITEAHNAANTVDVCSTFAANLTFAVDASFQGPHAGHPISVAVVRTSSGAVVAQQTGTVSAGADPAFSFTFTGLLVVGAAYQVHYWIDSNFGGGTAGVCDPKEIDHQWNVAIAAVEGDVTITEAHNGANTVDVCSTFAPPILTFAGDATFQSPHAGHPVSVAVVRTSDGAVVAQQTGTVSASADPAFSFTFTGVLVIGVAYQVHYWIDSNFGGGTAGVCDPKEIDHQWSVTIAAVVGDVTLTEIHNGPNTVSVDVCSTFTAPNLAVAGGASFEGLYGAG